jgi:hypothetical protein
MAEANYQLEPDVLSAANFKHDNRAPVGHFTSFKVGGEELEPDFNFVDPMDPKKRNPICGVVTLAQWNKKPGGVLVLEGRVSANNQGVFQDGIDSHDKTAECEFKFELYRYDVATAAYYKCFHTDGKAIPAQLSNDNDSTVDDDFAKEYLQIKNHKFTLYILGSDKSDEVLHIAYSPKIKKTFPFGQKCGA